jgi:transcriptional regulator of nitric oxide reductase
VKRELEADATYGYTIINIVVTDIDGYSSKECHE